MTDPTTAELRLAAAALAGLKPEIAEHLRGDTLAEMAADAATFAQFPHTLAAPAGGSFDGGARPTAPAGVPSTHDELRDLVRTDPAKFNQLMDEGRIPASAFRP